MRIRLYVVLCLVALSICAHAQTQTPTEATGSISGHVFCSDTNQPARFAILMIEPPPHKLAPNEQPAPSPSVRTALDGSFHFAKVKPGTYFLLAEYAGYVSPFAKAPPASGEGTDPAVVEKLEKLLEKITVAANKDTVLDIELERGATIAGTVHYDDGSPANTLPMFLFRQWPDGKLTPIAPNFGARLGIIGPATHTDDTGYFRLSGLPSGNYVLETTFPTLSMSFAGLFGGPNLVEARNNESASLSVYSGNVFRRKDAKLIELVAGEERDGADIIIPLLGLHSINGSILALSDGHPINNAKVELLYADDKSSLRNIDLDEDGRFNFSNVPQGEYILHITDPADTVKETKHDGPMTYDIDKPVHHYASVDHPLILHDDVSSLVINVPEKPALQKQ